MMIQTWFGAAWTIPWVLSAMAVAVAAIWIWVEIEPMLPARREWATRWVVLRPGDRVYARHPWSQSGWGRHEVILRRGMTETPVVVYSDWHWADPAGMAERAARHVALMIPMTGFRQVAIFPRRPTPSPSISSIQEISSDSAHYAPTVSAIRCAKVPRGPLQARR